MTDRPAKHLEFTTTVVAPIDEVWNALTTGEGLQAWYVAKATVEPGLGGEVAISWGEGPEGLSRIDIWEQPHRVRFAYVPQGGMEVGDQGGGSEEWFLTHDDGVTTVRLVHSLPDPGVEDWQGYYGDIERGWSLFLATLGYYVESTERRGRVTTLATPRVRGEATEVWKRLQAELGLSGPVARRRNSADDRRQLGTGQGAGGRRTARHPARRRWNASARRPRGQRRRSCDVHAREHVR